MKKNEFSFRSISGLADISCASFMPDSKEDIKYILQIAHGMAEHKERYEAFAERLSENGFAVYINDHIGHGQSISSENELGYFGKNEGWKNFVEDCHKLTEIAKSELPGIPVVFFGHSMGSFVSRAYSKKYADELIGAVFCGTAGPNPASKIGSSVASCIGKVKGDHHRSKFIDKLAFGSYNKRCEGRTAFDWLTRDNDIVDKYIADPHCGFLFTAFGYRDMFDLLTYVSSDDWFKTYPKQLPVLVISGAEDPVGAYSKGVEVVCDKLKATGKNNVTLHLYAGARHEILNESACFDQVCADIIDWVKAI